MTETQRLIQSAAALSKLLRTSGIPHAFYGSVMPALLANSMLCDEIFCIVEGVHTVPRAFKRVRDCLAGNESFSTTVSPWTERLHVTYRGLTPPVDIEILPAGETGPRILDASTLMKLQDLPFLNISEFVRARLKTWMIRASERDSQEICFLLSHYWNQVDINRIPEQDMNQFVSKNPAVAPAWLALRSKYGI